MSSTRKIDAIHKRYGRDPTGLYKCGECSNCVRYRWRNRNVIKCLLYGDTRSEASDWRASYSACGKFNQDITGLRPVMDMTRGDKIPDYVPLEGQIEF